MMFDLHGRVALVTGASAGLGVQFALALAGQGADLALFARRLDKLEEVASRIRATGRKCIAVPCDVGQEEEIVAGVARVVEEFGRIDILVNNAGLFRTGPMLEYRLEDWNTVIDVDLRSVFLCSREGGKTMARQRYGRIVNIASIGGITGMPGHISYYAAKGGVVNMTRAMAAELAPHGIVVNCICPGMFENEQIRAGSPVADEAARKAPLKRIGGAGDIEGICVYFASEESGYTTGQSICIDGGTTCVTRN
jgi:NAD(P)-dependent dehydrogenase (short-subunit alcohol dehydrogenase family)